jgi:hypothetical protein
MSLAVTFHFGNFVKSTSISELQHFCEEHSVSELIQNWKFLLRCKCARLSFWLYMSLFCCLLGFTLWRDTIAYGNSSPLTSLKELFFGKWWAVGNFVSLALEAANCSRVESSPAITHVTVKNGVSVALIWSEERCFSLGILRWKRETYWSAEGYKHCHDLGVEAPTSPACRKRHVLLYRSHRVMTSFIQQGGYSSKLP